jgi:hypothetical protein
MTAIFGGDQMRDLWSDVVAGMMLVAALAVGILSYRTLPALLGWHAAGLLLAGFLAGLAPVLISRLQGAYSFALLGYALGMAATMGLGIALASQATYARAALLLLLGGAAVACLLVALRRISKSGEPLEIESHWGGLGQGLGGWRVSSAAALLLCALCLAALAAVVVAP